MLYIFSSAATLVDEPKAEAIRAPYVLLALNHAFDRIGVDTLGPSLNE